jgi:hypothetical protein
MVSLPPDNPVSERESRLSKLLHTYIHGDKFPKTARDGKLFLEAISAQTDGASCVERLVASKNALESLRLALRFELTSSFFNTTFKDFLNFLQNPAIGQTCGGELLRQLLTIIVQPETLWTALLTARSDKQLNSEGELAFAWLLLELASWVGSSPLDVDSIARDLTDKKDFIGSNDRNLRTIGYRLANVLQTSNTAKRTDEDGPGGRHDNDHSDFRRVAIYPTDDELMSAEQAFYRAADVISQQPFEQRPGAHLDNQFRLLREDFLAEIREDFNASKHNVKGRRPRFRLQGLSLVAGHYGDDSNKFKIPFSLVLSTRGGLESFARLKTYQRRGHLKHNPKFLKHQSFGCVVDHGRVITFATLIRVEDLLVGDDDGKYHEPLIVLRAPDKGSLERLLSTLMSSDTAEFVMVDTAVFAYEPILRCLQATVEISLWQELFAVSGEEIEAAVRPSAAAPLDLVCKIEASGGSDLQSTLSLPKSVDLDASQLASLLAGLRQSVSLIQGPPGCGKSFIGALLAQALLKHTSEKILVICYKNHALDQFLEDLLDIGIPAEYMVRLGAKSTTRTEPLQLREQKSNQRPPYDLINASKIQALLHENSTNRLLSSLKRFKVDKRSLMEFLEFSDDDAGFFSAFQVPDSASDDLIVGRNGKGIKEHYLYDRWSHGHDAGVLKGAISAEHNSVWAMDKNARNEKIRRWTQQLVQERIEGVSGQAEAYDHSESILRDAWDKKDSAIIQSKRIIACTTTGAARYTKQIRGAAPGIILVEEAGEILESHVLTAMTPSTKQLILIGDHQQLRPKVNNYALTVEKGEGYDLNRSLFERLIRAGIPHITLRQQHRMCPEISSFVRQLTYPDLIDAPSTLNRDPVKGIRDRVVFIDHREPELAASQVADRNDQGATVSRQNLWEASMILKVVRYMAQQGYGTAQQVVLTPYLGQLVLLREQLAIENDPVLNDLDSADLVKAGLMTQASASSTKGAIRLSTIGTLRVNYSVSPPISLLTSARQLSRRGKRHRHR